MVLVRGERSYAAGGPLSAASSEPALQRRQHAREVVAREGGGVEPEAGPAGAADDAVGIGATQAVATAGDEGGRTRDAAAVDVARPSLAEDSRRRKRSGWGMFRSSRRVEVSRCVRTDGVATS
jgi:hypothetical protein